MAKCDVCGKSPSFGHSISHSAHKTKRQWKPNIQKVTVYSGGKPQTMKVCTRCLRTMNKA